MTGQHPQSGGDDLHGGLDSLYRDPLHYDLLAQMTAPADLGFYRRLLALRPGRVLELGCGTGRLSLPLSELADEFTGLDRAPAMLDRAIAKARLSGARVRFAQGDFCDFSLPGRYDWILLPYNAFNHVCDATAMAGLFASVARHLAPDGRFVVDTFQPDPAALAHPVARRKLLTYLDPQLQRRVELFEDSDYDAARRINRVTWRYDLEGLPDWRIDRIEMRIFDAAELDASFERHGFMIEAKNGDYDGSPFGGRSPKQLVVARPVRA